MPNKDLERHCFRLRQAIIAVKSTTFLFKDFPNGCCRDMSVVLGAYLKTKGFFDINYCHREYDDGIPSHGWLEVGDLILDLTADQFGNSRPPVVITPNTSEDKIYMDKNVQPWSFGIVSTDIFSLKSDYDKIIAALDENDFII